MIAAPPDERTFIEQLADTRWDVEAFARLLGIDPHEGQIRFWKACIARNETRWRAAWLTLCLSAGNRAGKTLALAVLLLHHAIFKIGVRPPDARASREIEAWLRAPYHWFHFGIQQEIGELVFFEITALLEGRHVAQKRHGCPLTDALGPIAETSLKERGEYRWVQIDPLLGGAEIHFRTTNERALGSLGKDMNGISFDECGFEQNLDFIVNEVLNMRRLGTGGPLILVSTPSEGFTGFTDEWIKGDPDDPAQLLDHLSLRMSTRENVGYGIDASMFDRIVAQMPPELIPQNIDGFFIEGRKAFFNHTAVDRAFVGDRRQKLDDGGEIIHPGLPERVPPMNGHSYVHGIDPALTYDSTWSIVLDVKGGVGTGVAADRRMGKQTMLNVVAMVQTNHYTYNAGGAECLTGLDTTGFGGKVFRDQLSGLRGLRNVEFGGTKARKVKLLTDLKGLLESGKLRFPRTGIWLELRRQLFGFRLDAKKDADDDGVMALAIAAKMMLSRPDASDISQPFDIWADTSEDEVAPEGYTQRTETPLDKLLALHGAVTTSRMEG